MTAAPVPNDTRKRLVLVKVSVSWFACSVTFRISALPAASSRQTLTGPVGWIWNRSVLRSAALRFFFLPPPSSAGAAVAAGAGDDQHPGREHGPARTRAAAADARAERRQLVRRRALEPRPVLLHEVARVEPQVVRVRAQERLDERGPGQQVPLLVLERAQVLGPDLRRRLDVGDVDPVAHARLAQLVPDLRHPRP